MPEETLNALEFPGLLRIVQPYAASRLGRAFLAELRPSGDLPRFKQNSPKSGNFRTWKTAEGDIPLV